MLEEKKGRSRNEKEEARGEKGKARQKREIAEEMELCSTSFLRESAF